jgi:hypothetical protein
MRTLSHFAFAATVVSLTTLAISPALSEQDPPPPSSLITFTGLEFAGSPGVIPIQPVTWSPPASSMTSKKGGEGSLKIKILGGSKGLAARAKAKSKISRMRLRTKEGRQSYYKYELKNVLVTSYSVSGAAQSEDVPSEDFSLNFEEIKVGYQGTAASSSGKRIPGVSVPGTRANTAAVEVIPNKAAPTSPQGRLIGTSVPGLRANTRREGPSGPQIRGIEATPSRPAVRPQDALDPKRLPALEPTPPKSGKPVSKEYQPLPTKGSGRIPTHSKEWTDHNIHDPGQTTLPESDESRTRKESQEDD